MGTRGLRGGVSRPALPGRRGGTTGRQRPTLGSQTYFIVPNRFLKIHRSCQHLRVRGFHRKERISGSWCRVSRTGKGRTRFPPSSDAGGRSAPSRPPGSATLPGLCAPAPGPGDPPAPAAASHAEVTPLILATPGKFWLSILPNPGALLSPEDTWSCLEEMFLAATVGQGWCH